MEIQKFSSASDMVQYLKGLKPADHFKMAKAHGIKPKDKADAQLYAEYIVQGVSKGLSGPSLVQYAEANVARLQSIMPHLKAKPQTASVEKPAKVAKTKKVKAPKAPSVAKPAKKAKVKYPDFTIVARPDRGGYEGWFGGKAEAFRDTVEKVHTFFQKKYQRAGQVLK